MSEKGSQGATGTGSAPHIGPVSLQQIISDPAAMSAISEKIASYINSQPAVKDLPLPVRRRVRALKNLQLASTKIEAEFYAEVQRLEAKYMTKYQPLLDKRRDIIVGSHEPTDEESHWSEDEGDNEGKEGDKPKDQQKGGGDEGPSTSGGASSKKETSLVGIEDFWLTALRNTDLFTDMIKEHDEEVLKHLSDMKIVYLDASGTDFSVEFHFSDNDWFTNKTLTKTYTVSCDVNEEDPWSYEGGIITNCKGCKIDWKKGKNLTVKTVKKKQKHKGRGQSRTVTKTVPNESFFNFFSPPNPEQQESEEEEEEDQRTLADDFARVEFLRDRLIPKAVLFYTGEAIENEEEFDEGGDDQDDDEDEDEDDDYDVQQDLKNAKPPECKQQ